MAERGGGHPDFVLEAPGEMELVVKTEMFRYPGQGIIGFKQSGGCFSHDLSSPEFPRRFTCYQKKPLAEKRI